MTHHFEVEDAKRYGLPAAVILYNLRFWIQKNKANDKHQHEGRTWTYCSTKAFAELFPYLSDDAIYRTLRKLEADGVIITGNFNSNTYDRTKWYAFADESFLSERKDAGSPENTKSTSRNREIDSANKETPFRDFAKSIDKTDIKPDNKTDERESTRARRKISSEEEERPDWSDIATYFNEKGSIYLDEQTLAKLSAEFYTYGNFHGFKNWKRAAELWIARKTPGERLLAVQKEKRARRNAKQPERLPEVSTKPEKSPITQQREELGHSERVEPKKQPLKLIIPAEAANDPKESEPKDVQNRIEIVPVKEDERDSPTDEPMWQVKMNDGSMQVICEFDALKIHQYCKTHGHEKPFVIIGKAKTRRATIWAKLVELEKHA